MLAITVFRDNKMYVFGPFQDQYEIGYFVSLNALDFYDVHQISKEVPPELVRYQTTTNIRETNARIPPKIGIYEDSSPIRIERTTFDNG